MNIIAENIARRRKELGLTQREQADAYLIYLPHGYEDTELKISYQVGLGEKVLKIEAENTTQIVDDKYYFCYVEIMNYGEEYDIRTYLNGEHTTYIKISTTSIWNVFE